MQALWTNNSAIAHAGLTENVSPNNQALRAALGGSLDILGGLAGLNEEITRQAAMIAYLDDFKLMILITLGCMPLLLIMRTPKLVAPPEGAHAYVD